MRKLFLPALVLGVLFVALVSNLYFLHKELQDFYFAVIAEETRRVESIIEGTVAGGGDPVEAVSSYMESSPFLVGATFSLGGREIIIPGSAVGENYYRKTVKVEPFTFNLYFDFSYLEEFNKHVFYTFVALLFFSFSFTAVTVWLVRKYFEEKLLYEKEKQEKERLESINLVIHSLLHEVKNRLNTLNLLLHRIERNCENPYVEKLKKEVEGLGRYLEETADLRRPIVLEKEKVDIRELVEGTVAKFSHLLGVKEIETKVNIERALLEVDPEKLSSVFVDLIKNAIEALEGKEKRKLKIEGKREGNFYVVSIMDSGGELPDTEKIFLPYRSTKKGGFGLGLYNAKRVVEAHGGKIEASVEGGWTVFRITLPLA
ncbi:sensor histidine kinase [Phorcysia thermohydrogeniphila]|uniref:histidine kinase n=1 Tax=Phorcysia thermohydrogeniphila TaxID=936138 RepID=A0A4R1GHR7_9BACT|nr:HAMP domain-containing sensor histidine kinase [Phorcysia thermohydrogeniphila]TCK06315.1 histidine kinase/DNA gyrase B/HSP90-like ATPase [Phorcysia thermohydrogeniphila]